MIRVAIFGGTFDPIHIGHLLIAEQAYNYFSLDKVVFMPAGVPPHKLGRGITDSKHRLEMVKLAIKDNQHFTYSEYEINKSGRSYTAETLRYLKEIRPEDMIFFIIGSDSLLDIFEWKETDYLLKNGYFIVAKRPGSVIDNVKKHVLFKDYEDHIFLMENPLIEISSSKIRKMVRKGSSVKYQICAEVISYIRNQNLYRGD